MTGRLPIFALGTVLFPGLVLPLHVFEERYRAMVADRREPATFGVVAIRRGGEVGDSEAELYDIGCVATIQHMVAHEDGRFDLVTVGGRRFRVVTMHHDERPYPVADIEWLDSDDSGDSGPDGAERLVPSVLDHFQRYLNLIRTDSQAGGEQVPDNPTVLSYVIAATTILPLDERQDLLACPTARERLLIERRLLARETTLLREIRALPVPMREFATEHSAN